MSQTQFRVLVCEETVWTNSLQVETKKMYFAVALEWYVCAQGDTVQQALDRVEMMLVSEAAMRKDPRFAHYVPVGPAPEEYQRLRNSGDFYHPTDKRWAEVVPPAPIVHRADIDLTKTKYRIVRVAGKTP